MATWTQQQDIRLRQLFDLGWSFNKIGAEIASEFKTACSRNAAIGRAHRLGIAGRKVTYTPEQRRERAKASQAQQNISRQVKRAQQPYKVRRRNGNALVVIESVEQGQMVERVADVAPLNVGLLDLTEDACRFPYGEGPFVFCGCGVVQGRSYCAPHLALTSAPARETPLDRKSRERAHRLTLIAEVVAA